MQLEDYFDFLAADDIRLKGHRIGIESVLYEYIYNAKTPHELLARFPMLNLEKIYATLLYYHQNQTEIDQYLADWLAFGQRMRTEQARNPHPAIERFRKLKADFLEASQGEANASDLPSLSDVSPYSDRQSAHQPTLTP